MQTPSQVYPLEPIYYSENKPDSSTETTSTETDDDGNSTHIVPSGVSVQSTIHFELKEEGNHVLAVNVTYTETSMAAASSTSPNASASTRATGGRVRTFRKLYQFLAMPCISVRTKASELVPREVEDKTLGPYGKVKMVRYALEAQLENVGDGLITLESTTLEVKPPFKSTTLNRDLPASSTTTPQPLDPPLLNPRDVLQVAFLLEQEHGNKNGLETLQKDLKRDGRAVLGQLSIEWRNAMGERGFLSTGNLLTRKR
ncbi:hypothetical protein UCRPC4_g00463 [Phaeomoniella chlamydospora]|uniref:Uncharacterized protein n=1 Tax=Phaeomoniella chlamydospora TaxID=158046 RepID=A0A0G2F304_PHACM|nr:hypothetical protein UCRPC4_g00463 [Phaeomoniella chlamydospora]